MRVAGTDSAEWADNRCCHLGHRFNCRLSLKLKGDGKYHCRLNALVCKKESMDIIEYFRADRHSPGQAGSVCSDDNVPWRKPHALWRHPFQFGPMRREEGEEAGARSWE
eukprot:5666366-Pleurochrysis_carterae.AAC.1